MIVGIIVSPSPLEAAKAGKPVCTRDGRKARIICFDLQSIEKTPIVAAVQVTDKQEVISHYYEDGRQFVDGISELDLMLEVPEYMTFKEGDVLTYRPHGDRWCIFVYKECAKDVLSKDILSNYVTYDCDSRGNNIITFGKSFYDAILCKPSTEEEKQNLFNALKESKEPEAKECLKKLGIEEKPKCEFKPFDRVLVRDLDFNIWYNDIFSFRDKDGRYMCIGNKWDECIPYNEETAHLLGTTDNFEDNK